MADLLEFIIAGIGVGMVYALIGLSFVLIWKSSGVANLALGSLVLIFSWFTYGMTVQLGLHYWIALPLVIIFALALGWLIERFALRSLIAQPVLSLFIVTLGVFYFLEGLATLVWPWLAGALPPLLPPEPLHIGGAVVAQPYLWAVVASLVLFALLTLYFRYNRMGIAMRATADDQFAVQACGIPVTRIFSTSWIFACVVAAIAGVLISWIGGVAPGMVETGMKSFSVVILGGLDSFLGCIVAGPIIGLLEKLGGGYLTPLFWEGVEEIIPFIIIIIILFIKPYGLFGEARIERI